VAQERLVARIVLHEHYSVDPTFVPYEDLGPAELLETDEDAALMVGPNVPSLQPEPFTIDIGREWYELANYPMVWGLYVTKRDQATDEMIEALIESAQAAEDNRDVWVQAQETTADLNAFYREDLRTGLDKLAIASLTEFRKYLFYYDVTEDVPDLPFVYLDEDEEEEEEEKQ
jgi:predicted solute-binding protein